MKRNKTIKEWTVDICKPAQAPQACRSSKQKPEFDREAEEDNFVLFLNASYSSTSPAAVPADTSGKPVSSVPFNVSEDTGLDESVCSAVRYFIRKQELGHEKGRDYIVREFSLQRLFITIS